MAPETRARLTLEVRAKTMTQDEIGAEMGLSQPQISNTLRRVSRPEQEARVRGAESKKLRIPVRWWLTPEEGGPSPVPAAKPASRPRRAQVVRASSGARSAQGVA